MQLPRRLQAVDERLSAGQFRAGLDELQSVYDESCHTDRLLMAELLLRTGERSRSESLVRSLVHLPSLGASLKARCYEHLGYLAKHHEGHLQSIRLYEKSLRLAERADDLTQICRTQLWLIAAKADAYGSDALGTLISEAAWNVVKLGDPSLRLFLHTTFAEVEGRRGSLETAERHIEVALSLLEKHSNLWMEARLYLLKGALAEATSDLNRAIGFTRQALKAAQSSGASIVESAAICNLGQLCVTAGQLEEGVRYLDQARSITADLRTQRSAVSDALAQVELINGRLDTCDALLTQSVGTDDDSRYIDLDNQATRVRCLQRRGELPQALEVAEAAVAAAATRSAHLLHAKYRLLCADVMVDMGRVDEAARLLHGLEVSATQRSLALIADIERVEGRIAIRSGAKYIAHNRFERASRILSCIGHLSALQELHRQTAIDLGRTATATAGECHPVGEQNSPSETRLEGILSAAKLLVVGQTPLLLGSEAFALIRGADCARRLALVFARGNDRRVVQHHGWPDVLETPSQDALRLHVGSSEDGTYEMLVEPSSELSSAEAIRAIFHMVAAFRELQDARRERTLRTTLWPVELTSPQSGPVFHSDKMRLLKDQALRMATTDLKVLITGETGVGKEVIARLIHGASKRSNKRFDAVNCSSVPRELFEAHLFGHQKGAFTGAINDSPGVIRGNDGGTVFFDEIGELSIDMQVKLLRVLDAQEVHPLGAPHAQSVDFRIIAATNADLFNLIEEKRFRDDLFYRLNVAILRVPPLRERREEILPFAEHFLRLYCNQFERPLLTISDEARECLLLYNWPGNIRELRNEMERLAGLMEPGTTIRPPDLKAQIGTAGRSGSTATEIGPNVCVVRLDQKLQDAFDQVAKLAIGFAYQRNNGNLEKTAKDLGLTRKGLYNKRVRYSML